MTDKIKLFSLLPMLTLYACSTPHAPPPIHNDFYKTDISLSEASYSVSHSLVDLAETSQAAYPSLQIPPAPNPVLYGMAGLASVDWSGPVEPLIRQIAKATRYRVRVLGREPAIPVLVTVYTHRVMLGDILRDIGYQCGRRAAVVIFPGTRIIELRYAKS